MTLALVLSVALADAPAPDGPTLYAIYCASCHGATGQGDGPAGATLDPRPARFADPAFWPDRDDAGLKKVALEGGVAVGRSPAMAGFRGRLDEAQVDSIIGYLRATFAPKAADAP